MNGHHWHQDWARDRGRARAWMPQRPSHQAIDHTEIANAPLQPCKRSQDPESTPSEEEGRQNHPGYVLANEAFRATVKCDAEQIQADRCHRKAQALAPSMLAPDQRLPCESGQGCLLQELGPEPGGLRRH